MERPRLLWSLTTATFQSGYHQRTSDWIYSEARSVHSSSGAKPKLAGFTAAKTKKAIRGRLTEQEAEEQRRERRIPFLKHISRHLQPRHFALFFFSWSRAQTEPPPPTRDQRRPFSQAGGSFLHYCSGPSPSHRVLGSIRPSEAALCNRGRRVAVGSVPNLSCSQYYTDRPATGVEREARIFRKGFPEGCVALNSLFAPIVSPVSLPFPRAKPPSPAQTPKQDQGPSLVRQGWP